jgi:Tyrosinase C-terminal domain
MIEFMATSVAPVTWATLDSRLLIPFFGFTMRISTDFALCGRQCILVCMCLPDPILVRLSPSDLILVSGGTIKKDTPLTPFWKTQTNLVTSVDCTATSTYGYTYPELALAQTTSLQQISQIVGAKVRETYGGGNLFNTFLVSPVQRFAVAKRAIAKPSESTPSVIPVVDDNLIRFVSPQNAPQAVITRNMPRDKGPDPSVPSSHPAVAKTHHSLSGTLHHLASDLSHLGLNPHHASTSSNPHPTGSAPQPPATTSHGPTTNPHPAPGTAAESSEYNLTPDNYRDWIANVTIEKYALNGSGRVVFFMGKEEDIPASSADWYTCAIYVGSFTIFASNPNQVGCANCQAQAQANVRIGGTVHLTKSLVRRRVPLSGGEPVEYLTKNLHWRVTDVTDHIFPNESVPSLKVVVQSAPSSINNAGEHVCGPWTRHPEITRGRAGGIDNAEDF